MADCDLALFQERLNDYFKSFSGEIWIEEEQRLIYATDASIYRDVPKAVFFPKTKEDIQKIIKFSNEFEVPIIPRGAGTSLAGQVVGYGLVVDMSRFMTEILEVNTDEKFVRCQPGVVRDKLNQDLNEYGLFFGPETSTSNRATIGGMVGNNSSGARSLHYGTTRESIISVKAILSNGEDVEFGPVSKETIIVKSKKDTLEGKIYKQFLDILTGEEIRNEINLQYPDKRLHRRNHGYALDILLESEAFSESGDQFNLAKFIAGSEGTLAFVYEVKLKLFPIPPKHKQLIVISFDDSFSVFQANVELLKYDPYAVELMDDQILALTEQNPTQKQNRKLIPGTPKAVLIVEIAEDDEQKLKVWSDKIINHLKKLNLGNHFETFTGSDINKIWNLRKAGLGVLYNMKGDAKPVGFIEDTAVHPEKLGDYIKEVDSFLKSKNLACVHYAHIGSGELHLRPILNLKSASDITLMKEVAFEIAKIVKKYNGSLSGEHGDGLLRSEFIPFSLGEKLYRVFKDIKLLWDPKGIFNPNKKTDFKPMETSLRYLAWQPDIEIPTVFDFSESTGLLRAAERCNGSGDCRNSLNIGEVMCPSYKASGREDHSTRARANIAREYLTKENDNITKGSFYRLWQVYSTCLSCKACKSECPSSVDITKIKAELLQKSHDKFGIPFKSKLIANIENISRKGMIAPGFYNFFISNKITGYLIKNMLGFAKERQLPKLYKYSLRKWIQKYYNDYFIENFPKGNPKKTVNFFVDEFTNYQDVGVGISAIKLLTKLGYVVEFPFHLSSGRTYLSKGFVRMAKEIVNENIKLLGDKVTFQKPLVGIEPSAILTFRDEYIDLANDSDVAKTLSKNTFTIEEFLVDEFEKGNVSQGDFLKTEQKIIIHTHCYQKSLSDPSKTVKLLNIPEGTTVEEIKSGCCGMAGSFGFEKEHYKLSMDVGNLVLFPAINQQKSETIVVAPGTSCRHQIKDGTKRHAKHPVEVLFKLTK